MTKHTPNLNSEIKIEKGILVPTKRKNTIYPWRKMAIGDSFVVTNKTTSLHAAAKQVGIKIVTRTVKGGKRVWRVA